MAAQPMIPVMQTGKAGQQNPWALLAQAAPILGQNITNATQNVASRPQTAGPGYSGTMGNVAPVAPGPGGVAPMAGGGQMSTMNVAPAFRVLAEMLRRRMAATQQPAAPTV